MPRLRLVGELFVNAVERSRAELVLREREGRLRLAASAAEAGLWIMNMEEEVVCPGKVGTEFCLLVNNDDDLQNHLEECLYPYVTLRSLANSLCLKHLNLLIKKMKENA